METAELVADLSRPEAWPTPPPAVEVGETHISLLFFVGDRVFKVKKDVDLGFLDASTPARRRFLCEEEVRLNQRLSPDVYLGLAPIVRGADGRLELGEDDDEAVEWAVEMRRLPARGMLDAVLERGEVDNQEMDQLADLLARFHARAATGAGVDECGTPEAIERTVREALEVSREFVAEPGGEAPGGVRAASRALWSFLEGRARNGLARHAERFAQRVRDGRVRDGHGDLHSGNICLTPEGIRIYDCIEFQPRFRCGDVAKDLAFLLMDLDLRGFPAFGSYLARRYMYETWDPGVAELLPFYKEHLAVVRANVAGLTAKELARDDPRREAERRKAMRYFQLAASYELPPAMVLMCGLPASGKSWAARELAPALGAARLQSDVRRKILAGLRPTTRVQEAHEEGLYSPDLKRRTYRSLLELAVRSLEGGHSVVVDASFARAEHRRPFIDAAERLGQSYYVVHVTAPEAVVRERMAARAGDAAEVSDADLGIYEHERARFEPLTEVPVGRVLELESPVGVPEDVAAALTDHRIGRERQA